MQDKRGRPGIISQNGRVEEGKGSGASLRMNQAK